MSALRAFPIGKQKLAGDHLPGVRLVFFKLFFRERESRPDAGCSGSRNPTEGNFLPSLRIHNESFPSGVELLVRWVLGVDFLAQGGCFGAGFPMG